MSRPRVVQIELHDGFFIPGLNPTAGGGSFGKSLPSPGKTLDGLEMYLNDNGSVEASWGRQQARMTLTIGAANIKYVRHATPTQPQVETVTVKTTSKAKAE